MLVLHAVHAPSNMWFILQMSTGRERKREEKNEKERKNIAKPPAISHRIKYQKNIICKRIQFTRFFLLHFYASFFWLHELRVSSEILNLVSYLYAFMLMVSVKIDRRFSFLLWWNRKKWFGRKTEPKTRQTMILLEWNCNGYVSSWKLCRKKSAVMAIESYHISMFI